MSMWACAMLALGSFAIGVWRSLVARVVRDDEAAGSNPVTPTNPEPGLTSRKASQAGFLFFGWLVGAPNHPGSQTAGGTGSETEADGCRTPSTPIVDT